MRSKYLTSGFRHNVKKKKQRNKSGLFQKGKSPKRKLKRIKPHNKNQRKNIAKRFKKR